MKITNYKNDLQISYYGKRYNRKEDEGSAEGNDKRISKRDKHDSTDNIQNTWYNSKTSTIEVIPEGFEVIQHPFTNEYLLFPLPKYIQSDTWYSLGFEILKKLVQQQMDEEKEKRHVANVYRSLRRTKQTIYNLCRANAWDIFVTFTVADFDKRYELDEVKKLVRKRIASIRTHKKLTFGYILIPEQHKDGAWHFHGLMNNISGLHLERAVNKYGKRVITDSGMQVYSIKEFESIGFNSVTYVQDNSKVCRYITKYVTKDLVTKGNGKQNYLCSKGLSRGENMYFDIENKEEIEEILVEAYGYAPTLTHGSLVYNPYLDCSTEYRQYRK